MKIKKIPPPNSPKTHYRWAGIEEEKEELEKMEKKNVNPGEG